MIYWFLLVLGVDSKWCNLDGATSGMKSSLLLQISTRIKVHECIKARTLNNKYDKLGKLARKKDSRSQYIPIVCTPESFLVY